MRNHLRVLTAASITAAVTAGLLISGDLGAQSNNDTAALSTVRNDFTNATLNDRYGFSVIAHRAEGVGPFAISGFYKFDGKGNMIGRDLVSETASDPPTVFHREYSGTYVVRSNGTGVVTLDISPDFKPQGHFTIVDGGEEIEIVFAVEGNANAFTLKKQNTD
jgi:hypothetical protein